jgi:predicted RNase H-like HicB family nuclease
MKYEVIIYWSEEDRHLLPNYLNCSDVLQDGETYQEALQNLEIIMQEWIETANALGSSYSSTERSLDVCVVEIESQPIALIFPKYDRPSLPIQK